MESGLIASSPARRALKERVSALADGAAFKNYEVARDRVLDMREQVRAAPEYRPSAYWEEELSTFEYMLDATPLVIEKLRHHTHCLTGLRAYDYRSHKTRAKTRFA